MASVKLGSQVPGISRNTQACCEHASNSRFFCHAAPCKKMPANTPQQDAAHGPESQCQHQPGSQATDFSRNTHTLTDAVWSADFHACVKAFAIPSALLACLSGHGQRLLPVCYAADAAAEANGSCMFPTKQTLSEHSSLNPPHTKPANTKHAADAPPT